MRYLKTLIFFLIISNLAFSKDHPCLILGLDDVQELKQTTDSSLTWATTLEAFQQGLDDVMDTPLSIPLPKDPAGGFTHEQHKYNAVVMKQLGINYQLSSDEKYAALCRDMFMAYAKMYPSLDLHPVDKSYARGRLFWQQLNEAVFLCDAIQGYDAIYDFLTEKEKAFIEKDFLLPFADFLSIETPYVFNKIHNHGVWAAAAVGMTGFVLDNEELVCRAFYGINDKNQPVINKIDGYADSQVGFFAQVQQLFSPDGYYTEGPYYQRYAMTPFLLFAQSINQNLPELDVFAFSDSIFINAVYTLLNLTDDTGEFYPFNDHLKGMGIATPSMVWAIDLLYAVTKDDNLLSYAKEQGNRTISMGGFELSKAMDLYDGTVTKRSSQIITDGPKGEQGGVSIMRMDGMSSVFKYASQGMNHGHFDRLNLIHFNGDSEVLCDYGAARFVNVQAKQGGRYLPENDSYAKQTVAHNTVVINEESHFDGQWKEGQKYYPEVLFSDFTSDDFQIIAAKEDHAYENSKLQRTIVQLIHPDYENPILVDLFAVNTTEEDIQIDLPFHFNGQVISRDFVQDVATSQLTTLGSDNGYQHLWLSAKGQSEKSTASFTWMQDRRFYSLTHSTTSNEELIFAKIGAGDANFNLRNEPVFMVRNTGGGNHTFVSVLESHGYNNACTEKVTNQDKMTETISLVEDDDQLALKITTIKGNEMLLLISYNDETSHTILIGEKEYSWEGNYKLIK